MSSKKVTHLVHKHQDLLIGKETHQLTHIVTRKKIRRNDVNIAKLHPQRMVTHGSIGVQNNGRHFSTLSKNYCLQTSKLRLEFQDGSANTKIQMI